MLMVLSTVAMASQALNPEGALNCGLASEVPDTEGALNRGQVF